MRFNLECEWDDRGTAFATWRVTERQSDIASAYLVFKLCYIVRSRLPGELASSERDAVRAQLDGVFPPRLEVIYLDHNLTKISDPALLELLKQPYVSHRDGGHDYNLGSRMDALYDVIDAVRFSELCSDVRARSEELLRSDEKFIAAVMESVETGTRRINLRLRRLRQKLSVGIENEVGLRREIAVLNRLLPVLGNPVVTLDSVGVTVLSRERARVYDD